MRAVYPRRLIYDRRLRAAGRLELRSFGREQDLAVARLEGRTMTACEACKEGHVGFMLLLDMVDLMRADLVIGDRR
jgi:hypothetical protein